MKTLAQIFKLYFVKRKKLSVPFYCVLQKIFKISYKGFFPTLYMKLLFPQFSEEDL